MHCEGGKIQGPHPPQGPPAPLGDPTPPGRTPPQGGPTTPREAPTPPGGHMPRYDYKEGIGTITDFVFITYPGVVYVTIYKSYWAKTTPDKMHPQPMFFGQCVKRYT